METTHTHPLSTCRANDLSRQGASGGARLLSARKKATSNSSTQLYRYNQPISWRRAKALSERHSTTLFIHTERRSRSASCDTYIRRRAIRARLNRCYMDVFTSKPARTTSRGLWGKLSSGRRRAFSGTPPGPCQFCSVQRRVDVHTTLPPVLSIFRENCCVV